MPNIKSYGDLMVSDSQNTRVAPFLGSGATALSVTMGAYGRLHLGHKHGRPSVQSLGSERESDETATFTQLSSPAEPRGTRCWSPPSAWPSTADTAGSYSPGRG